MAVRHKSRRTAVVAEIDRAIRKEITQRVASYERTLQEQFRKPKSGRIYYAGKTPTKSDRKVGRRFRSHRASAPGEAPAIARGALRKGVAHQITKVSAARYRAVIGVTSQSGRAQIALWLELGTRRIRPRPGWRVALAILQRDMAAHRSRG